MNYSERLKQPLDAKRVKSRTDGRGGKLSYLETHDVIRAANDIFGFGRWGHEVVDLREVGTATVHNREQKAGLAVGYVCIVRLTVEGCVPVSGVGFGDATEYRESAPVTAHELAAKEAESDALKRALKNYGDQFGLALYDKDAARSGHVTTSARADGEAQRGAAAGSGAQPAAANTTPVNVFGAGKYKGKTLAEVAAENRQYLEWASENWKDAEFQQRIREFLLEGELVSAGAYEDDDIPF